MTDIEIMAVIDQHPNGLTSMEVAAVTGKKLENVSSRLSKLYHYGKITRRITPSPPNGWRATWLPKQNGGAQ